VLAGEPVAYLVTEYADENLGEVLHDRPLPAGETRKMLLPVSDALAYLHRQSLVHGNLKPSKILAVGSTVKISTEAVCAGDPAEDIRALGVSLVEALTRRAPPNDQDPGLDALPFPFRELAENCLQRDVERRWSAHKIAAWLRSPGQPPSSLPSITVPATKAARQKPKSRHHVVIAALTMVGAIVGVITMRLTLGPIRSAVESRRSPPDSAEPAAHSPASAARPIPPVGPDGEATRDRLAPDEIVRRVLPNIPEKARKTIGGKPAVVVRVSVDPAGEVTQATLERSFSPYFGKLVLEAARQWRFARDEAVKSRNWILRFEITKSNTRVTARKAGAE
jgi:TonB family protein